MKKQKHWKMPKRLWSADRQVLNFQQKHFLSFIWWTAPRGCHCWNNRLAKRFKVSPRTIQRWIKHLRDLKLIAIGFPDGRGRTIWPRYQQNCPVSKIVDKLLDSGKQMSQG